MSNTTGCEGDFSNHPTRGRPIQVFDTCKPFYPLTPIADDLDIEVIAHSLSLQCRYNGHCREFYSVAEHSIRVSLLCENYPREGLMHDAAEAYLGDIIKPLKLTLPDFELAEKQMEAVIAKRWGLEYPWPQEVKDADMVVLATEKRDLCCPNDLDWGPMPAPLQSKISPRPPQIAEVLFLDRAEYLGIK